MDDGYSPVSMLILILFILLEAHFTGLARLSRISMR